MTKVFHGFALGIRVVRKDYFCPTGKAIIFTENFNWFFIVSRAKPEQASSRHQKSNGKRFTLPIKRKNARSLAAAAGIWGIAIEFRAGADGLGRGGKSCSILP